MFITKILQLNDKNSDNFKDSACSKEYSTAVCCCRNTTPVTRYMC